jgi:2-phospho-L-lactate guanylyltransferase (CobY/MobA/RfbA family)
VKRSRARISSTNNAQEYSQYASYNIERLVDDQEILVRVQQHGDTTTATAMINDRRVA